jgi:hypothetical protein
LRLVGSRSLAWRQSWEWQDKVYLVVVACIVEYNYYFSGEPRVLVIHYPNSPYEGFPQSPSNPVKVPPLGKLDSNSSLLPPSLLLILIPTNFTFTHFLLSSTIGVSYACTIYMYLHRREGEKLRGRFEGERGKFFFIFHMEYQCQIKKSGFTFQLGERKRVRREKFKSNFKRSPEFLLNGGHDSRPDKIQTYNNFLHPYLIHTGSTRIVTAYSL